MKGYFWNIMIATLSAHKSSICSEHLMPFSLCFFLILVHNSVMCCTGVKFFKDSILVITVALPVKNYSLLFSVISLKGLTRQWSPVVSNYGLKHQGQCYYLLQVIDCVLSHQMIRYGQVHQLVWLPCHQHIPLLCCREI